MSGRHALQKQSSSKSGKVREREREREREKKAQNGLQYTFGLTTASIETGQIRLRI